MATLHVKGVDDRLLAALAARAAADKRSISQEVVFIRVINCPIFRLRRYRILFNKPN